MPKTKKYCEKCSYDDMGMPIIMKRAYIREYIRIPTVFDEDKKYEKGCNIPIQQRVSYGVHAEFKNKWIPIGWFCACCKGFKLDE